MSGEKAWRAAASIILLNTELRQVLMMKRGASAKFMPNSFVFPGGVLDPVADGRFPLEKTNFHEEVPQPLRISGYDNDYTFRVAATRELFEESGLLMSFNENCRESSMLTATDDPSLAEWMKKVRKEPKLFSELFFGSTKLDVKSLIPWSNWLTPLKAQKTPRFDTMFFVASICNSPAAIVCEDEMVETEWSQPSNIIKRSSGSGEISLPPPQFYELMRIRLAVCGNQESLEKMVNPLKITPQIVLAADDPHFVCNIMPGDHLYDDGSRDTTVLEMVAPKIMPKRALLDVSGDRPVHRMTYASHPPLLQYTHHELHVKNTDEMRPKQVHLFSFSSDVND